MVVAKNYRCYHLLLNKSLNVIPACIDISNSMDFRQRQDYFVL